MTRAVGLAGAAYLSLYVVASLVAGPGVAWLADLAQLVPPLAYAAGAIMLARRCRDQVWVFWNLNAVHGVIWAAARMAAYFDVAGSGVPVVTVAGPIFFASSIPLAAALYGRPERDRPRWLFNIVLLDIVLIALFAAFAYIYFAVSTVTGPAILSNVNVTPLVDACSLLIALWAVFVWRTSVTPAWRRVLGVYALGLAAAFVGGIVPGAVEGAGSRISGAIWELGSMVPYVVMAIAAAMAYDAHLFEPTEEAPALTRLPVLSLLAVALLAAIPAIDEVARRAFSVSPATDAFRTRLALAILLPFGLIVVVREWLWRRALLNSGQELASTREQLVRKEKLAAVGQLVGGVAHELNNPLQGILGYAELMLAAKNSIAEKEELRAILDNANRAAGIVRNLLTFAGRASSARGWQQMNHIVRDAAAARGPHLQAAGIDLRMELAERLPLVYIDATRLNDVLINLIQNAEAAIASRRDGETPRSLLSARARGEVVVTTTLQAAPDCILVAVADNGGGLKEEDLSHVFNPFFTTRATGHGTALGLSVCHGIVREHGGQITAKNGETGGAVFTIELPVRAESPATESTSGPGGAYSPPPAEARPAAPAAAFAVIPPPDDDIDKTSRRRTALVVDDEESNAALVRRVLAGAGYDVESTTLSRRALVIIERTAYDAVICDVKMPELSGQELYARVCQIRPEMSRRFIFITGDIDGEDTRRFLDESHCSYFMKPFNLDRLTAAVDTITGSKPPDTIG
jgi:signal transduction histidine kinase/CheY-like chemotaxis protein